MKKEFLTFDDVILYLQDDFGQVKDLLAELVRFQKLTPVLYYHGLVGIDDLYNQPNHRKNPYKHRAEVILNGYFSIDRLCYEHLYINQTVEPEYPFDYYLSQDDDIQELSIDIKRPRRISFPYLTRHYTPKISPSFDNAITYIDYQPYKMIDDFSHKTPDGCFTIINLFADYGSVISFDDILYPRAELDAIFKTNSQKTQSLTANSQKAVAKLLYALLKEHGYQLGATKGATNDILLNLTEQHGVGLSRETIAKWLDAVNNL